MTQKRYFSFDSEEGFELFNTEEEARASAELALEGWRELARGDEWGL